MRCVGSMLTLCFSRSSLLRGALIMTRRTLEGALKCALRDFLREEWRANFHRESALLLQRMARLPYKY